MYGNCCYGNTICFSFPGQQLQKTRLANKSLVLAQHLCWYLVSMPVASVVHSNFDQHCPPPPPWCTWTRLQNKLRWCWVSLLTSIANESSHRYQRSNFAPDRKRIKQGMFRVRGSNVFHTFVPRRFRCDRSPTSSASCARFRDHQHVSSDNGNGSEQCSIL